MEAGSGVHAVLKCKIMIPNLVSFKLYPASLNRYTNFNELCAKVRSVFSCATWIPIYPQRGSFWLTIGSRPNEHRNIRIMGFTICPICSEIQAGQIRQCSKMRGYSYDSLGSERWIWRNMWGLVSVSQQQFKKSYRFVQIVNLWHIDF